MNAKLSPASSLSILTVAAVIAMGIFWAIVSLFQSRGVPMERLAAAERACAHQTYQSEREVCTKQWLAESKATRVAIR